ncbi:MAG: hypothetical protein AB4352_16940 [Hormoscilla sp.]
MRLWAILQFLFSVPSIMAVGRSHEASCWPDAIAQLWGEAIDPY